MANYPLINGHAYDFQAIEIDIDGVGITVGVKELSFNDSLEAGVVRGTRPEKLARTVGQYDAEGSIVLFQQDYFELIQALSGGSDSVGVMTKSFNITVTYSNPNMPVHVARLIGCRIKTRDRSYSSGLDALEVSLDLDIMRVEEDGINPLDNQLR